MTQCYSLTQKYRNANADMLCKNFNGVKHEVVYNTFNALIEKYDINLKTILDFGAGNGRDAVEFAKRGISVMAMEPGGILTDNILDRGLIKGMSSLNLDDDEAFDILAKKEGDRISQWLYSVQDTPDSFKKIQYYTRWLRQTKVVETNPDKNRKDNSCHVYDTYDAVICNAFAHYIHPSDRQKVARDMMDIVKPGGLIFFKGRDAAIYNAEANSWPVQLEEIKNYFVPNKSDLIKPFAGSDLAYQHPQMEILHAEIEPSYSTKKDQHKPHAYPTVIARKISNQPAA